MEHNNEPSDEEKDNWHNDPDNWIWGMFYYNPKDKRIFLPKRIKQMGFTINFANPSAVFFTITMIEIFRGSYMEAMNIKNLLENNNIPVFTANEYMSSIQPWSVSVGGNGPAILKVQEKDTLNGKKIIDNYNKGEYNLKV